MDQSNTPLLSRSNSVPEHISVARHLARHQKKHGVQNCATTVDNSVGTTGSPVTAEQKPHQNHPYHGSLHGHVNLARRSSENIVVHFAAATPIESPASAVDEPLSPMIPGSDDHSINRDQLTSAISLSGKESLLCY